MGFRSYWRRSFTGSQLIARSRNDALSLLCQNLEGLWHLRTSLACNTPDSQSQSPAASSHFRCWRPYGCSEGQFITFRRVGEGPHIIISSFLLKGF